MTTGRICFSPSYKALRDHAFAWLDDTAGDTPESARFLDGNAHQHQAITDAWRDDHDDIRLTVSNIAGFAQSIHERLYGPYPDVETLERRRAIEQALKTLDADGAFEGAQHHTPSVTELFGELEADDVPDVPTLSDRLDATDCTDDQRAVLLDAYESYLEVREQLSHPDAKTQNEKLADVATADRSLTDALPHLDAIAVSTLEDPSTTELAVLERLADEFPVLVLVPTPTPDSPTEGISAAVADTIEELRTLGFEEERVDPDRSLPLRDVSASLYQPVDPPDAAPAELTWHEAPTPDREVRHLARTLRERLASDDACAPDDLLVLAPGLLSYRDAIADVFDAYGVGHAYHVSVLLERTYVGRAVLDAIECCEQPRADRIAELSANPLVALPDTDPVELADVQRRLYTTSIDAYTAELDDSADGVENLLERIRAVRTAGPDRVVDAVHALLDHLGLEEAIDEIDDGADISIDYETRAYGQVTAILDSVRTVCEELDPDEPLAEVATALEGVRVRAPTQVTDDRVEIVGLQDTPMADFEELYVLGATAEHLSGTEMRPRYFQSIGEELGVYERHAQRDIDRYRFGNLLANAQRVHVTTPETTIDDEPLLVSPFLDELARVTGLEPEGSIHDEPRGAREDLQRALAGTSPTDVESALEAATEGGYITAEFANAATRGAECGGNRGVPDLTPHDGQLSPESIEALDDKLTSAPYSHSRLSTFATCGFKYLLSNGWRFDEEEDLDPGIDALTFGDVVHDTVENFFHGLQGVPGEQVDVREYDRADLERQLLEAAKDAIADAEVSIHDVFGEKTLRALFSGLASPDANEYYAPPGGETHGDPAGALVQFLDQEFDLAEDGHRPRYFEADIGDTDGVTLPNGRTVPIGGIVDRIDETPDGITVFDYKTSTYDGARRRENSARDGLDFQLPIYALGAPGLLEMDAADASPEVAARYYVINDGPTVKIRRSLADRFDDIDFDAFVNEVVPDRLDAVVGGIEGGAFHPTVVDERTAKCSYCEFSDACDVRHHRRYDVIDHVDDADHPAYVPAGATPGDVLEELPGGADDE